MRKTKKQLVTLGLVLMLASSMSMTAFAGEWKQDTTGWWYEQDGGYATGWQWINGKCYFFDGDGYMAKDTVIDGYSLNADGQWVVDGIVQTQGAEIEETGFNENGVSNLAIDILEHTRAENAAKYGESRADEIAGEYYVYYDKTDFLVNYYKPDGKPSYVSAKATDIFRDAPMTGNAYDDKDTLISNGYSATTNGGYVAISCGKYLVDIRSDQKTAKVYIKFDYR